MRTRSALAAAVIGIIAAPAFAGQPSDAPYRPSFGVGEGRPNTVRLVQPAQLHPEVAVSRTLSAQPVHPHLAEVRIGESMVTYIDPARRLDRRGGLDSRHQLVRAQRLARQLQGITTRDLAELSNAEIAAKRPAPKANRVRVIHPAGAAPRSIRTPRPAPAGPAPATEPAPRPRERRDAAPDAPRQPPPPSRQLASSD